MFLASSSQAVQWWQNNIDLTWFVIGGVVWLLFILVVGTILIIRSRRQIASSDIGEKQRENLKHFLDEHNCGKSTPE